MFAALASPFAEKAWASLRMVPAPKNPIPVITPAVTLKISSLTQGLSCVYTIAEAVAAQAPTPMRIWVLSPASFP